MLNDVYGLENEFHFNGMVGWYSGLCDSVYCIQYGNELIAISIKLWSAFYFVLYQIQCK